MARAVNVASGTVDAQGFNGSCALVGVFVRESAATAAAAEVILRDGTAATAPLRLAFDLGANEEQFLNLPAIEFATGVFVDRVAGETELVLYLL